MSETASEKSIFLHAANLVTSIERSAYLEEACADPVKRARIAALLSAHDRLGGDIPPTAEFECGAVGPVLVAGHLVEGRFKLVELIGEGGMGSVWRAEQTEPIQRTVAIKLIKAGMDSKSLLARFEAERQALAIMDHPNIAKVLDGGLTEDGRPFIVMELVQGIPITKYCDEHQLTPRQRLELYVPVCQAIQHAHQKGIIHRDIKPSNVLVTRYDERPVPKVIDFGVAKATGSQLNEKNHHTGFGYVVGTVEYMSPEQASCNQLDVDTRSDIYSLGVLLYELLVGTPPFTQKDLEKVGMLEMLRVIREQEPAKPSSKLSAALALPSLAAKRGMEPNRLTQLVRGELDWIVMKCLEKDRNRRYETANGFAADVQRYLADEQVLACPPSARYRLRKFVRRNRMSVFAASIIGFVLVVGAVGTTIGLMEAHRQRDAADRARIDESREKDRALAAEQLASNRLSQVESEKQRADEARAIEQAMNDFFLKDLIGQAYSGNQPFGSEFANLNPKITVREVLDRARKVIDGKFAGQPLVEAAVRLTLADTYLRLGEYALAIPHAERALALSEARLSFNHPDVLAAKVKLAEAFSVASRPQEAIALFEQVHKQQEQDLGPEDLVTITTLQDLACAYSRTGRRKDALGLFEKVYAVRSSRLTRDDPRCLNTATCLAEIYLGNGKTTEALAMMELARDAGRNRYSPEHPGYLTILQILARAYLKVGRTKEAIALLEKVRDGQTKVLEADHPQTLQTLHYLADGYKADGQRGAAILLYEQVAEIQLRKLPVGHIETFVTLKYLARAYKSADRLQDVIRTNLQLVDIMEKKYGPEHQQTVASYMHLGHAYKDAGKLEQALKEYQRAVASFEKVVFVPARQLEYIGFMCKTAERLEQYELAERWWKKSLEIAKTHSGAHSIEHAVVVANLGLNLVLQQRWADAEAVLRPAHVVLQEKLRDEWITFGLRSILGEALLGQKKYKEAEPLLLEGYDGLLARETKIAPDDDRWLIQALERLIRLYELLEKPDRATEWRKKLEAKQLKDKK